MSAASSGILYWGWDLGDVPDSELYLRSAATAAFVPIMQYHSEFERHGDDRVIAVFRRFVELRERLVPYLADAARSSISSSSPLMRPLYFDYPANERVWDFPLRWMLGDDILVAPVLEPGVAEWELYLPPGEWVDAFSGAAVDGGVVVSRPTSLEELPVYVRAAAWPRLREVFAL